jgi:hypothetical protein
MTICLLQQHDNIYIIFPLDMTNLSYNNHFLNEWQGHWSHMKFFMITSAMSHGLLYEPNTAQIWKSVELCLKPSLGLSLTL